MKAPKAMTSRNLLAAVVAASAIFSHAGDWTWRMPIQYYQNLDFEKRDTIDKAVAAFVKAEDAANRNMSVPDVQIPLFRTAAAEWKKYTVRFDLDLEDENIKAYAIFMNAMSLKGARDRNAAMKIFEELLDFYPDEKWVAPAARFMIGECQIANGENTKAKRSYLAMVASDPDHPLACRAYRRLGDLAWKLLNAEEAIRNWRLAAADTYKDSATTDWRAARDNLIQACVIAGKWDEAASFFFEGIDQDAHARRVRAAQDFENLVGQRRWQWGGWWYDAKYLDKPAERDKAYKEIDKGILAWHEKQKGTFAAAGQEWDWLKREFNYRKAIDFNNAKKLLPDMAKCVKDTEEKAREGRAREFANFLCDARLFAEAHEMEQHIPSPLGRLWFSYEIDSRANDWNACILTLEQIMKDPDPEVVLKGKKSLAWIYKDRLRDFEKALKIYREISTPPGTLWDIQYCLRQLGKKQEAQATLQELEFFPDQRAQAIWVEAEYYREDGNKDMAVARYRRLLSDPDLKKSQQSSQAHQRLEAWGIATGGAVVETIR